MVDRGSRVRIAAATFSIFAFEALKDELAGVERLQFIFTAPAFVASNATDKLRKERREFFIPQAQRESSLYGSEFEIRLRNKLTQRAIARECAEWIKEKVEFRSNRTGAPMQQFAVVDDRAAYQPLHGFTSADLGFGTRWTCWRNGRDSNPRALAGLPLSRRVHLSALPPFRRRG